MRFEIIHVRAGAVNLCADGVARAVDETIRESLVSNVISSGIVYFEAADVTLRFHCTGDGFNSAISGVPNHLENLTDTVRR